MKKKREKEKEKKKDDLYMRKLYYALDARKGVLKTRTSKGCRHLATTILGK